MNIQLLLILFSVIVFFGYVSYIWKRYGVLYSISASYYELPSKLQFIFTLVTWGYCLPLLIVGNNQWFFLAGASLAFTGASPAFKEKVEGLVHVGGTVLAILFANIGILLAGFWYVPVILGVVSIIIALINKHSTWWIEIVSYIGAIVGLLLIIFK
jgi:hypothetical protein